MDTKPVYVTNRLALVSLLLSVFIVLISPPFILLLDRASVLLTGERKIYPSYYHWFIQGGFGRGSNPLLFLGIAFFTLIIGITSLVKEKQIRWLAIFGILLGVLGLLGHAFGLFIFLLP